MWLITGAAIAIAVVAIVALVVISGGFEKGGLPAVAQPDIPAPAADLRVGRSLGDPEAPVKINVFEDPQCPACGAYTARIEPLLIAGPVTDGQVFLTYKDYPFIGQESLDAAVAMRVAEAMDGKFWDYHAAVFHNQHGENQGAFTLDRLADIAELAGLDRDTFLDEMKDPAYQAAVQAEVTEGASLGVQSTPSLFVNGELVRGVPTWEDLKARISTAASRRLRGLSARHDGRRPDASAAGVSVRATGTPIIGHPVMGALLASLALLLPSAALGQDTAAEPLPAAGTELARGPLPEQRGGPHHQLPGRRRLGRRPRDRGPHLHPRASGPAGHRPHRHALRRRRVPRLLRPLLAEPRRGHRPPPGGGHRGRSVPQSRPAPGHPGRRLRRHRAGRGHAGLRPSATCRTCSSGRCPSGTVGSSCRWQTSSRASSSWTWRAIVVVIAVESFPGVPFGGILDAAMELVDSMRIEPAAPSASPPRRAAPHRRPPRASVPPAPTAARRSPPPSPSPPSSPAPVAGAPTAGRQAVRTPPPAPIA